MHRKFLLVISVLVVSCCAPHSPKIVHLSNAADVELDWATNVSVRNVEFTDNNNTSFVARLWHPTKDDHVESFGKSRIRPGYKAVSNGAFSLQEPAPVIILVHGSGGSADSMAWIAAALAKRGAIVVAADHPESSGGNPERKSILHLWSQPQDVTLMIDQLLISDWAPKIDPNRISVVGFSLGGSSALMLAGARLNFEEFISFCETHDDGACRAFEQHFDDLDDVFFAKTNGAYGESRLKASVAIAPGFTETMTPASLSNIDIPTLILTGANDQQLPPKTHIAPIIDFIQPPIAYKEIIGAQHFSFLPLCGADAITVLAETNEEFVCEEVGKKTRAQLHAEALFEMTHFLCAQNLLGRCIN